MAEASGGFLNYIVSKKSRIKTLSIIILIAVLLVMFPAIWKNPFFYLLMGLFMVVITLNGNSIMNEGGLDIATLLHFGIILVYGVYAGLAVVLITTAIAIQLSKMHTPIDFFLQKNFAKVLIQTAQLFFTTLFTWAVLKFYGFDFIMAHLPAIFILAFTAGRVVKGTMLLMFARVPAMKVFIGTVLFYIVNWYVIKFLGVPFITFLQTL